MTSKEKPQPGYLMLLWVNDTGVEKVTFPGPHPNTDGYACYTAVFPLIKRLGRAVVRWNETHDRSRSRPDSAAICD